jgi:hypothetical protein
MRRRRASNRDHDHLKYRNLVAGKAMGQPVVGPEAVRNRASYPARA